ncbi:MAG: XrtA/PEP-CTERM system TPR-repeat protein PrsT [Halioglobus sp.]
MKRSVASAVIFIFILLGLGACAEEKTTAEYVAFAKSFREVGDLDSAVVELKNALRQSPDSVEARWILGSIYLDTGDGEGAEKELRRCADLGMEYSDIVVPLMQAMVQQEKYREVIDTLFDEPSMDDDALKNIWLMRGHSYLKLQELAPADEAFDKALALVEADPEALLGKARVAANRDTFEKARSWLDKVFAADPAYAPAWSFLGDLEQFQQNPEAAEQAYTKALESRPNDVYDLASRAMMRIFQNKLKSAEQDFQSARRENARLKIKQPLVLYVRGQLNLKRNKNEIAAAAFDTMLEQTPSYLPARFFLAVAHYKQGNIEQAEENLGIFRAKAPRYTAGHRLYAALKFSQGNYNEARQVLEDLLSFDPDDAWSLALLADVAVLEGDPDKSVENYRRIVELHPESEGAHLRLALGLMLEDQEAARRALAEAERKGQNVGQTRLLAVVSHLNASDWDSAIATAKKLVEEQPDNWDALTLLGGAYVGSGEVGEARKMFNRALQLKPGNPNAASNLARLELKDGNIEGARKLYEDVLKYQPAEPSALLALSTLDQQQGEYERATKRLEDAVAESPNNLSLRLGLARLYLRTGQPSRNLSLVYEAKGDEATDPRILEVLGRSQMALGQYPLALNNFKNLVEARNDADSNYLLAQALMQNGNLQDGKAALDKVVKLQPDHLGASVMRVRMLRQQNRPDEALEKFDDIDPAYANRPEVLIENGWLSLHKKDYNESIAAFGQAFEIVPSSMLVIQLGIAHWNAGQQKAALKVYQDWLKDNPEDRQVMFHLANSYMERGDDSEAVAVYRTMDKLKSDDSIITNNIAWLLRDTNPTEAMQWAQKTVELTPEWGAGLDTLGVLQLAKGDLTQAHRTFEKASQAAPNSPDIRYHLALATSRIGEGDQAARILKALLSAPGDFESRPEAEALLQKLSGS